MPEYEAREAARFNLYTWREFVEELDYAERCAVIATYRLSNLIQAHVSDAVMEAATPPGA